MIVNNVLKNHRKRVKSALEFASFYGGIRTDVTSTILPLKYAVKMQNFSIKNGALTTGLGVQKLKLPAYDTGEDIITNWQFNSTPLRFYVSRDFNRVTNGTGDKLIVYNSEGKMAYSLIKSSIGMFVTIPNLELTSPPKSAINFTLTNGQDVLIFGNVEDKIKMWHLSTNNIETISDSLDVTSLCTHYERVFATVGGKRTAIWFSDELDPTNWNNSLNEGGYIELADKMYGGANKIISFNNFLYVFRDYGITRISAYASQTNFSVAQIYSSSSLIYANTVCACGGAIYFMKSDGLYSFDGVNVTKVNLGFENLIDRDTLSNSKVTFYKNKYCIILNTTLNQIKSGYLNTLITFDISKKEYDILSGYSFVDILGLISENFEKMVAIIYDRTLGKHFIVQVEENGKVLDYVTPKIWESAYTDLGYPNYEKAISRISLQTKTACTVKIETEKDVFTLNFSGSDKTESRKVCISGTMFKITFISNEAECEISHPSIEFSLGKPNA